ncbi:hypothetical protein BS78_05G257200 [Paspalum vaginatum]|nr:hypothetical protein BS78_05G257200 [Paspalum vaginatum]
MRTPSLLLVTLAVLAILAALPLGKGKEGMKASSWPCCDNCGICNRKNPPDCQCLDVSRVGCHPECKKCVKFTADEDAHEAPIYRCADMLTNFCKRGCPAPQAAGIVDLSTSGSF